MARAAMGKPIRIWIVLHGSGGVVGVSLKRAGAERIWRYFVDDMHRAALVRRVGGLKAKVSLKHSITSVLIQVPLDKLP